MKTGGGPAPDSSECQGTQPEPAQAPPAVDPARELGKSLAAYFALLDEVATETQYHLLGKRENPERIAYLGSIIERAAYRRREEQRRRTTP